MTSHQIQSTAQVSRDPQITQSILPYHSSSGQISHKSPAQAAEIDRPECDSSKGDSVLGPSPPVAVSSSRTEMPVSTHDTGRKDHQNSGQAEFKLPASMPPSSTDCVSNFVGHRIFLDFCCGVNSPLPNAVHKLQGDHMRFDLLVHPGDDLLKASSYERLLRLCASGMVAYTAASPSCCEYSRLKLLPNGPPALRTPNQLQGVPGLTGNEMLRVQESFIMLERCINCLQLTISAGGHGHLEQPKSAMSWGEEVVQKFISQNACSCISMSACGYGRDWHNFWLFASTYLALSKMACSCPHPKGSHQQIAGVRTDTGHYLSRATAEYPSDLADQFAQIISPLLTDQGIEMSLDNFPRYLPTKGIHDPPFARQDGAGLPSRADWSGTHGFDDSFQALRKNFSDKLWTPDWTKFFCVRFMKGNRNHLFPRNSSNLSGPSSMNFCLHKESNRIGRFLQTSNYVCIFFSNCAAACPTQMCTFSLI